MEKYGTTTKCIPDRDFPEFGDRVQIDLERGNNVIAIEAFVDKQHLDWFLNATNRSFDGKNVYVVWLECRENEAIKRKAKELSKEIVQAQHRRVRNRHRVPGELTLDTTHLSVDEVTKRIVAHCGE